MLSGPFPHQLPGMPWELAGDHLVGMVSVRWSKAASHYITFSLAKKLGA